MTADGVHRVGLSDRGAGDDDNKLTPESLVDCGKTDV